MMPKFYLLKYRSKNYNTFYMLKCFHIDFLRRMNFDRFFPRIIFVSDLVIYVYSFFQFEKYNEYEIFFLFYGMIFVLLFDWFLWGGKKFSWLQIIKFSLASLSLNYLAVEIHSFFLLSFDLFFSNIFRKGEKGDKIITRIVIFFVGFFVLFRFYAQGLISSVILTGENIFLLLPLLVLHSSNESSFFKKIPVNKWELFCQNKHEIPRSLISWYLPFCIGYLLVFNVDFFCIILLGITILFCFVYDVLEMKRENENTFLDYFLEKIYKFGTIFLLLCIKDNYG